ncbi:MAG TPA: nitrogenase component 1 [Candidatus Paceibacterota bacterium]
MRKETISVRYAPKKSYVSTRNACKLCSPLGASIAFRGVEGCIPLIHGSQGCATYIRRYVISHFREPIDIASSNFSESSAIFGGGENLKGALDNVIRQYQPAVIGVATTCLSETIGDDVTRYIEEYRQTHETQTPPIIHASTPSYSGTHMEGFRTAIYSIIGQLAEGGGRETRVNIISSLLSAEDLRYIKEIVESFGISYTLLPDYSETLDGESWDEYHKVPQGGTPVESIRRMGCAAGTIELGSGVPDAKSGSKFLNEKFSVPAHQMSIPIGIDASDKFFGILEEIAGRKMSERYAKERGRLVDAYIDAHKYLFGAKVMLYGEADLVAGISSFLAEIGVKVVLCATGARRSEIPQNLADELAAHNAILSDDTDFATMLERAKDLSPDIIIGSSKGFYLSKNLGVPLVRCGFPIHDRFGGQRVLHVGYRGTMQLLDRIVNAILGARQRANPVGYSYM